MAVTGVGVDIVKIRRFKKNFGRRFIERCFTASEMAYIETKGAASMAGLFAAKEAAAKAIGTGFSGFWPCDIEVTRDERGKPYIVLHGKAKAAANGAEIHISISHTDDDAVAFAVAV